MRITSAFGARNQFAGFSAKDKIFAVFSQFFDFIEAKHRCPFLTTFSISTIPDESPAEFSGSTVATSSMNNNNLMNVLQNLTSTLSRLTQASEAQMILKMHITPSVWWKTIDNSLSLNGRETIFSLLVSQMGLHLPRDHLPNC